MPVSLKPIKWYKNLATKKGRSEAGVFSVEGDRAIRQIIAANPDGIIEIIAAEEPPPAYRDYPVRLITENQFESISSTRTPQGTMAIVRIPADMYSDTLPEDTGNKILLLEDIQDPGNVGTLIRTAAAFDFHGVILSEKCADPLAPKCVQATAGTVMSLWLRRTENYFELIKALKEREYPLIAADLQGTEGPSILADQSRLVLALGNEAAGLSSEVLQAADYRVQITIMREKAESLNVAACGAILMYLCSEASSSKG